MPVALLSRAGRWVASWGTAWVSRCHVLEVFLRGDSDAGAVGSRVERLRAEWARGCHVVTGAMWSRPPLPWVSSQLTASGFLSNRKGTCPCTGTPTADRESG